LIALVFAGRNSALPHVRGKASRIHFPGRQLSQKVDNLFQQETGESPAIIGGPWWEASNVAFYGQQSANVFADLDESINPWMTDETLNQSGGVIVWTKFDGDDDYKDGIALRFPNARFTAPLELDHQTSASLDPVRFGVAIIAPSTASFATTSNSQVSTNSSVHSCSRTTNQHE
jgi:hypothetical protein